jgi:hypothetical protein
MLEFPIALHVVPEREINDSFAWRLFASANKVQDCTKLHSDSAKGSAIALKECNAESAIVSASASAKVQPWVQLGISRRAYYYRKKGNRL